jgi:hypothetical protein
MILGCGDNGDIIRTYVIDTQPDVLSGCTEIITDNLYSCSLTGITVHDSIYPVSGDTLNIGSNTKRFRDINTVSGTSTVWTSTNQVITPTLNLGLDSQSNLRIINADNSIIRNDTLFGGTF